MKKKIFITGAGSGFGCIAALGLAQRGHQVIATAETGPQVQALKNEAAEKGIELVIQKLDLFNPIDHKKALEHDIDILLNIAGICEAGPLGEQPLSLIRRMFEVNVFCNLELTQGFVRQMAEKKSGKILFMSSMSGLVSFPLAGAYCASKHALEAMAEALKDELAPFGIKVATINPGPFKTGFNESGIDSIYQWYDPQQNFTPEKAIHDLEALLSQQFDPQDILDIILTLVESDKHPFRNIWPAKLRTEVEKKTAGSLGPHELTALVITEKNFMETIHERNTAIIKLFIRYIETKNIPAFLDLFSDDGMQFNYFQGGIGV